MQEVGQEIARNAKSAKKSKLKSKTLPLIHGKPGQVNTDNTDQKQHPKTCDGDTENQKTNHRGH